MSEETQTKSMDVQAPALPVVIHAQYLKDLSFESPNSPDVFKAGLKPPEMDMNFNLDARKVESDKLDNLYEVVIRLNIKAERPEGVAFMIDCSYGALVSLEKDIATEMIRPVLFVEVPQILFPFARQVVAQASQNGGFPPLMLNPIDFRAMYVAQNAEGAAKH